MLSLSFKTRGSLNSYIWEKVLLKRKGQSTACPSIEESNAGVSLPVTALGVKRARARTVNHAEVQLPL